MQRWVRLSATALVAVVLAAFAAACGSSSSKTSASAGGSTATSASSASGTTGSGGSSGTLDTAVALSYTGGKAGPADSSKAPFTIGYLNQQGGALGYPEQTAALDAAVKLINQHLGGIDGHPLVVKSCYIQAVQDGQKCGAQFADDPSIKMVSRGLSVYGNSSFYSVLGGKLVVIGSTPGAGDDNDTPGVYELNSGSLGPIAGMALRAAAIPGVKTVAIISSNNPAGTYATDSILKPALAKAGIKATSVLIPDTATGADVVSAMQAAGATSADVIMGNGLAPMYIAMYDGLKQLGLTKPVVAQLFGYGQSVLQHAGGHAPDGWSFNGWVDNPLIPGNPQTDAYVSAMKHYGAADVNTYSGDAPNEFGAILTIAKLGNQLGFSKVNTASIKQWFADFRGPAWMVPGPQKCGAIKAAVSLCTNVSTVQQYKDGKWDVLPNVNPS